MTENAGETEKHAGSTKTASGSVSAQAASLGEAVREFLLSLRRGPLDRRHWEDPSFHGPERRTDRRGEARRDRDKEDRQAAA